MIRVDGQTLVERDRIEVRVRPDNLGTAEPTALALAGYSPQAWEAAAELEEALELIAPVLGQSESDSPQGVIDTRYRSHEDEYTYEPSSTQQRSESRDPAPKRGSEIGVRVIG